VVRTARVLSGLGTRALGLSLLWCVVAAWQGASPLPFGAQMVPILAVWFVAVQEGMTVALDSSAACCPRSPGGSASRASPSRRWRASIRAISC
jgi:hypothetical protein